ncbi:MAG: hypothetical protein HKN67_07485, partial [Saprospiraceae bacterium]|nr:hypothetical protein [Saprospiraceae bacterium]
YYLVSPWILGNTISIWGRFYDYTTKEFRQLVRSMILGNSRTYLNWALKALGNWNTKTAPADVNIHIIHGSQDKTFPIQSLNKVSFRIKDGGHFMVYKHAEEISKFINEKMIVPVE